jgi:cytochrome o ubiquinol oxidase operon protein cyoD
VSTEHSNPLHHPEVQQASAIGYVAGYVVSVLMLLGALLLTTGHVLSPMLLLAAVSGLALVALVAQTFFFYGLDVSQHQIWKSVSLVLTVPLFVLSIGLTVWMFHELNGLTMMMPSAETQSTLLQ